MSIPTMRALLWQIGAIALNSNLASLIAITMYSISPTFRRVLLSARFYPILCLLLLGGCGGGGGGGGGPALVTLDHVFPARGSASGGDLIQLKGQGFMSSTQVRIDGQDCQTLTVQSSSSLACVTPAHRTGTVDIQVINADGGQAMSAGAYVYRPTGAGISSFGILATTPVQGAYADEFIASLESVLTGFDQATVTRSWVIDGKAYAEGDSVAFERGSHVVTLTIRDATGDSASTEYSVLVGSLPDAAADHRIAESASIAGADVDKPFTLEAGKSISLVNAGFLPLLNPRFIGAGKPDYVDWQRYLSSLAHLDNLPSMDTSESNRAAMLDAAWKDLSNSMVHVCSPGREGEDIYDPALLLRGYGYECCSNSSRALAYLGSFMDIPARVRSTADHEFPEFTIGGNMFVLDPDLRYRFWADDQLPLSAWTSDTTPVSMMNVSHYYVETPSGQQYEATSGGALSISGSASFLESTLRSHYFTGIVGETIWGYREAFSTPSYLLYPNEKIAFRQTSNYVALQRLNGIGEPTGGNYAPAVGKVVFRRLWSTNGGVRDFQQDVSGNRVIRLNDLPYPVQDLTFYFSKPIKPQSAWLTAGGKSFPIGDFAANIWTVSAKQLRAFGSLADLAAVVSSEQGLVAVDIGMQYNPGIFGDPAAPVTLSYTDDNGACQRKLVVTNGGDLSGLDLGSFACDPQAPQRIESSLTLAKGGAGTGVISSYGNSYQGTWGLSARAQTRAYAEISLPRTPGLAGTLRASTEGVFSDWEIYDGTGWTPLATSDVAVSQWMELPPAASATTLLRVTLRQAPLADKTYLSYLSLVESRTAGGTLFGAASMSQVTKGQPASSRR